MRAVDREDNLYSGGKRVVISVEEEIMFYFLDKHAKKNSRILDVGCGTGEITQKIIDLNHRAIGVDFSKVALEIAEAKGIACFWGDLDEGIKQPDNEFDVVWAGDVIEHVFDPIGLISEVKRVMAPDGVFLFTIPYDLHISNRIRAVFGISYQEPLYKTLGQCKHHTFFTDSLAEYMLEECGMQYVERMYVNRLPLINKIFSSDIELSKIVGHSIVYAVKNITETEC